jgi:AbiV family abortive infection protein
LKKLRAFALENATELVAEAELLFQNGKFARTYTLAHLSSEELAKLPLLAAVGVDLVNGATIDWKKIDEKLRSHKVKLKGLLFVDLLGKDIDPTNRNIQVHEQMLSRIELFSAVEAVTHGRIAELSKRDDYMKLLNTLGVGIGG